MIHKGSGHHIVVRSRGREMLTMDMVGADGRFRLIWRWVCFHNMIPPISVCLDTNEDIACRRMHVDLNDCYQGFD